MSSRRASKPAAEGAASKSCRVYGLLAEVARGCHDGLALPLPYPARPGLPQAKTIVEAWRRLMPSSAGVDADLDRFSELEHDNLYRHCEALVAKALALVSEPSGDDGALHSRTLDLAVRLHAFEMAVRRARFSASKLLKRKLTEESARVLTDLGAAFKKLDSDNRREATSILSQLQHAVSCCSISATTLDLCSSLVRKHLASLQRLPGAVTKFDENLSPGRLSLRRRKSRPALAKLLDLSIQTMSFLCRFVTRDYQMEDEPFAETFLSNVALLSSDVVQAAQLLVSKVDEGDRPSEQLRALSRFCVASKALKDMMAGEEQFGDEPLQGGTATGRQVLYSYMKRMQALRKELRECLSS
ncbi:Uncharacterized protein PBTT_03979 [Plasmodiophora brassicae]|uniref:Uncharacterized protein n=1 Tax=Plasmodiophora brassicae TaxID=37360 RepID=A0A0G4J4P4_PLABS|nr:hypothetical protein PBRA_009066 [Plasmodiophora brassicae]SPQ96969.1 unnamed protein product [Plasmodiophora brassicae]